MQSSVSQPYPSSSTGMHAAVANSLQNISNVNSNNNIQGVASASNANGGGGGVSMTRGNSGGSGDIVYPPADDKWSSSVRRTTLTRPERQRRVKSMLRSASAAPPAARLGATTNRTPSIAVSGGRVSSFNEADFPPPDEEPSGCRFNLWVWFSRLVTCCCIPPLLRACGKTSPAVQQAWREKVALCIIIVFWCFLVGYLTFGLRATLCPDANSLTVTYFNETTGQRQPFTDSVIVQGYAYSFSDASDVINHYYKFQLNDTWRGHDLTRVFQPSYDYCAEFDGNAPYDCHLRLSATGDVLPPPNTPCLDIRALAGLAKTKIYFNWDDIANVTDTQTFIAFNGEVMNPAAFLYSPARSRLFPDGSVVVDVIMANLGRDATKALFYSQETVDAAMCLMSRYPVGFVDKITPGCFTADLILDVSLIVILTLVLTRFVVALIFYWCLSHRMYKPKPQRRVRNGQAPAVQPAQTAPMAMVRSSHVRENSAEVDESGSGTLNETSVQVIEMDGTDAEQSFVMILVTCYSEGQSSIKSTLDSLAATTYPDKRKLLFIVADGLITGSGNDKSTPDIIIDMMELDPSLPEAVPQSYIAIAEGAKQHNMAYAHAGYYNCGEHRVPTILVVKCGTPSEATSAKPGNRGKRDSQLVLMNFLSRCVFDDMMTALDYTLCHRITHLTGVAPDAFEYILMVDADTKVEPPSVTHMVTAMVNDPAIMGLCGETRISNKTSSWVAMIQVFEYYISHHLGKAFESAFGGVTCLPGCFCMYRVKVAKGPEGYFVPILVNPDIVEEYSENVVDTLHKKNLLLLGEDRFLTTLLLRNFPKRKMVFVPKAICRTVVPDEFRVLLSQRRRWINSTVHNLLELVLVRDLCGVFCFSMQFVVLLELIGTIVLPAAICFTIYLILKLIISAVVDVVPVLMLIAILGLPGFLIVITSGKLVYVGWMLIYLLALPIWNFVLPAYAFWHFDDFSWGETRKVEGETKADAGGHGTKEGTFNVEDVILMRWEDWERERRERQANRQARRERSKRRANTTTQEGNVVSRQPSRLQQIPSNIIPPDQATRTT
ncbi:hypothetical protein HK101_003621, partial [Irineochytrium annulatum]